MIPYIYDQLIFHRGVKIIKCGEGYMVLENLIIHLQKDKSFLLTTKKTKSKWIKA